MSRGVLLVLCMLCELCGIVIFLRGFFPIKSATNGFAQWKDYEMEPFVEGLESSNQDNLTNAWPSQYRKVVIVLIDALRADFVLPTPMSDLPKMSFVHEKIVQNESYSFLTQAHPPTVTLPRIKAITSGSIPGFVDVILNFDSKELLEDNLITQLKTAGKHLVFYGDDTWMNLFPDHFSRTDGTTSFFVSDFTQVDDNVTRHISRELLEEDWDVLILHYLGLDHIGHLTGPRSPLVEPKLKEMDHIVETIYNKLSKKDKLAGQPSLVLLCGDHGMSNQGSHGGSSYSETATPAVFLSSKMENNSGLGYEMNQKFQVDIAPTLSLLLGLPIPQNSLGILLMDAVQSHPPREKLQLAYINAQQITEVFKKYEPKFAKADAYQMYKRAVKRHQNWLKLHFEESKSKFDLKELAQKSMDMYVNAMRDMRAKIVASLTTYDLHAIGIGITIIWMMLVSMVMLYHKVSAVVRSVDRHTSFLSLLPVMIAVEAVWTGLHLSLCTGVNGSELLCTFNAESVTFNFIAHFALWLFVVIFSLPINNSESENGSTTMKSTETHVEVQILYFVIILGSVGHIFALLASSFIEEEHQIWYCLTMTAVVILGVICLNKFVNITVTEHNGLHNINLKHSLSKFEKNLHKSKQDIKSSSGRNHTVAGDGDTESEISVDVKNSVNGSTNSSEANDIVNANPANPHVAARKKQVYSQYRSSVMLIAVILMLCRVLRCWNNTGDKWAHLPDVGDWLVRSENKVYLSVLTAMSLVSVLVMNLFIGGLHWRQHAFFSAALLYIYMLRSATGDLFMPGLYDQHKKSKGTSEGRTVYFILFLMLLNSLMQTAKPYRKTYGQTVYYSKLNLYQKKPFSKATNEVYVMLNMLKIFLQNVQTMWLVLMMLLVRPHNIALVAMEALQVVLLSKTLDVIKLDIISLTVLYSWMGNAAFFYQGNSNSIATVDVSAGYTGIETYQPVLVGVLLAVATYAGPVMWLLALLVKLTEVRLVNVIRGIPMSIERLKSETTKVAVILQILRCSPVAVYVVSVALQRYHLFVWTVFSPKLLYEGMHSLVIAFFTLANLLIHQVFLKICIKSS